MTTPLVEGAARPLHVIVAPDKFKGSLSADSVAKAIATGLRSLIPDADVLSLPIADGGEGTVEVAVAAGFSREEVIVSGPTGPAVRTAYARRGSLAVVELADACGLGRLPEGIFAPETASSRGAGELLRAAMDAGCTDIVLGIGGSASTDGGAGLLVGLGALLLDNRGREVAEGGSALAEVNSIDLSGLTTHLPKTRIRLAADVDNPLVGPLGAAATYGPQKGCTTSQVELLDAALAHWADVVADHEGVDLRSAPGAGAAGGVGFAALAVLRAQRTSGIELILDLVGFGERVAGRDLCVTGEGSLDAQSLFGKGPIGVARAAALAGVPTVAVCGRSKLGPDDIRAAGLSAVYALQDIEPDLEVCIRDATRLLTKLGRHLAHQLLDGFLEAPTTAAATGLPSPHRTGLEGS